MNTTPLFSIGLTGGIGSGKSTVATLLAQYGAAVIDTDQIAHALTASDGAAMQPIIAAFGSEFVGVSGALDRLKMRQLIFNDPSAKQTLEAILHPLIWLETQSKVVSLTAAASIAYLVFVVPLLVESQRWRQRVNRILVVDCPEEMQIARVMQRNSLSESEVRTIVATQASRDTRLAAADDVITNDGASSYLEQQAQSLHALYCRLALQTPS
jgi:dephospho-CoA kinase